MQHSFFASIFAAPRRFLHLSAAWVIAISTLAGMSAISGSTITRADSNPNGTAATQITGTVFHDFNSNGVMNTSGDAANPAIDVGVAGVTVSAYVSGTVSPAATTTSGADGTYTLSGLSAGMIYRVEFTNLPTGYYPSFHGSSQSPTVPSSGTDVQFVVAGTSNVSFGINRPCDYCQANPNIVSTQQQKVDGLNASQPALIEFPYTAGSNGEAGSASPAYTTRLTEGAVGTVAGLAYSPATNRLFLAAHMRRYTRFGPGGPGAIYVVDGSTNAVLNSITVPGATTNLHNTASYASDYIVAGGSVTNTWDAVGKTSLGGIAVDATGNVLYVVNLENRTLYALNTASGAVIASQGVPLTACPGGGAASADAWPYALTMENGALYVGVTCTAQSSQNASDLQALIYRVDPATLSFGGSPVFSAPLNYKRGKIVIESPDAAWRPWYPVYKNVSTPPEAYWVTNPQPWLTSIAFDGANLILGLRDRFSDQVGRDVLAPGTTNVTINGISAGDTLRACASGSSWVLEGTGGCVNASGGGVNNTTFSEFYTGASYAYPPDPIHDETSLGTVLQLPGYPEAMVSVFNPVFATFANRFTYAFRDGVRWMNNTTGAATRAYETTGNDFGKNGALGDMVALCDTPPIEIGNRVWRDENNNGIQDAGEPGIGGVTVTLVDSSGNTASTVTASDGTYYFSRTTLGPSAGPLQPYTQYTVTVPTAIGNLVLTTQKTGGNQNVIRDSDANPGTGQVTFVTGGPGQNNHDFDFGYVLPAVTTPSPSPTPIVTPTPSPSPTPTLSPVIVVHKLVSAVNSVDQGVRPGDELTYTIVVSNVGQVANTTPITVTDVLNPQVLAYVPGSAAPPAYFVGGTITLTWVVPIVQPGQAVLLTFRAAVQPTALEATTAITNVAMVQTSPGSPTQTNLVIVPFKPTAVTLSAFTASPDSKGGMKITWRTSTERNTFGFTLLHSKSGALADALPVTSDLVAAKGPGAYTLTDANGSAADSYWLRETELDGSTAVYGPAVSVTQGEPAIVATPLASTASTASTNVHVPVATMLPPVSDAGGVALPALPVVPVVPAVPVVSAAANQPAVIKAAPNAAVIEAQPTGVAASAVQPVVATPAPQTASASPQGAAPAQPAVQAQSVAQALAVSEPKAQPAAQADEPKAAGSVNSNALAQAVQAVVLGSDQGVAVTRGGNVPQVRLPAVGASTSTTVVTTSKAGTPAATHGQGVSGVLIGVTALLLGLALGSVRVLTTRRQRKLGR